MDGGRPPAPTYLVTYTTHQLGHRCPKRSFQALRLRACMDRDGDLSRVRRFPSSCVRGRGNKGTRKFEEDTRVDRARLGGLGVLGIMVFVCVLLRA